MAPSSQNVLETQSIIHVSGTNESFKLAGEEKGAKWRGLSYSEN
jgi:hypothetical protein